MSSGLGEYIYMPIYNNLQRSILCCIYQISLKRFTK